MMMMMMTIRVGDRVIILWRDVKIETDGGQSQEQLLQHQIIPLINPPNYLLIHSPVGKM